MISENIMRHTPKNIAILTKTLSGFNNLNYHTYNTGESYIQECEFCEEEKTEETANHIITECIKFNKERYHIFNDIKIKNEEICASNQTTTNLHNKHLESNLNMIIKFINETKLLEREIKITKRFRSPNRTFKKAKTN